MRKKKIIGIILAAALVAAGLGGLAYAQATNSGYLVAVDQPFRCAYIEPDLDSVAYDTPLSGHYSWNFHMQNNTDVTIDHPTISVETSHPEWFPDVTFPASWDRDKLDPGEKWYEVSALRSTDPITFTLGYDCSRTMEPLEIPSGGGVQTVTIKVRPVDGRYTTNPYMRISVSGTVIEHTEPGGAVATINPEGIAWDFRDWTLGMEYTFTAELQVENPLDVDLLHKPHVQIYVESAEFLVEGTGTITTISDEILGGVITYSVATAGDWHWPRIIADCWLVEYKPLSQPLLEHEPMTGQKLVGMGGCSADGDAFFEGVLSFTNPDCVSEITIKQLSIIKDDGTVIHEGELLDREGDPLPMTLGPHEAGLIVLRDYVARHYGLDPGAFRDFPRGGYTVEIFWSGAKEGLPLIGWSVIAILELEEHTNVIIGTAAGWSTQMVNMEQVLKLEKPKEEK